MLNRPLNYIDPTGHAASVPEALIVAYYSARANPANTVYSEVYANGISVAGTTAILDASGRAVLLGSTTGNGGRFDMVEVDRGADVGYAYEIEPEIGKVFGQAEIDFKVTTYNALGVTRYSKSKNYETPSAMIHGDKFGTLGQVVGVDPNDPTRVIVAWQDRPGLILWESRPMSEVPRPIYLFEWDPKAKKAVRRSPVGTGWAKQPVTTITVGDVIVTVGAAALGTLAGAAAGSAFSPPTCSYVGQSC